MEPGADITLRRFRFTIVGSWKRGRRGHGSTEELLFSASAQSLCPTPQRSVAGRDSPGRVEAILVRAPASRTCPDVGGGPAVTRPGTPNPTRTRGDSGRSGSGAAAFGGGHCRTPAPWRFCAFCLRTTLMSLMIANVRDRIPRSACAGRLGARPKRHRSSFRDRILLVTGVAALAGTLVRTRCWPLSVPDSRRRSTWEPQRRRFRSSSP